MSTEWLLPSAKGVVDVVVTDREQLVSIDCREVYDWWVKFQPSLPMRSHIPLAQFGKLLPKIYLSQLIDDNRFEVKIQGERVKMMLGGNKFPLSFSIGEPGFSGLVAHNYREAIRRKLVLKHSGTLEIFERGHVQFESADFPIAGEADGSPYILGVMSELQRRQA